MVDIPTQLSIQSGFINDPFNVMKKEIIISKVLRGEKKKEQLCKNELSSANPDEEIAQLVPILSNALFSNL